MKTQKFDCIGRVPASISDLDKCDVCLNESLCMSMQGIVTPSAVQEAEKRYDLSGDYKGENDKGYILS